MQVEDWLVVIFYKGRVLILDLSYVWNRFFLLSRSEIEYGQS